MSNINLEVRNSEVIRNNLVILGKSRVENGNLILDADSNFVIRFTPKIMQDNDTMQALYETQKTEIEMLDGEIHNTINNTFIESLNLKGIQEWEKILNLESNSNLNLNTRKELIALKRLFKPPFTRQNLQRILESVWGNGNYTFEIYPNLFEVIIDIHASNPDIYLKFQQYVRDIVPANMFLIFSVQYTYLYLYRNYSYNDLSALTYGELSQYA